MSPKYVDYKSPPVIEVVFGVTFENELPSTALVGGFWSTVQSEFPHVSDQKPLPHTIEGEQGRRITISDLPQPRRVWIWSENNDWLIQLQPDRFIVNWKREQSRDPYPSFDEIFKVFRHYLGKFEKYVFPFVGGALKHDQYELTYINHIDANNKSVNASVFDTHIDHVRHDSEDRFLGRPLAFKWLDVYELPDSYGVLRVSAQHAEGNEDAPASVRLELSAKGFPPSETSNESKMLENWFDQAHKLIVKGFSDVTNPDFQKNVWGRTL